MSFTLSAPARAAGHKFLDRYPAQMARRGMGYFVGGAVQDVMPMNGKESFSAVVSGTRNYKTMLAFDPAVKRWVAQCNCPIGVQCKHAYALMKTLLVVPLGGEVAGEATPAVPVAKRVRSALAPALTEALGRPLTAAEAKFLETIGSVFAEAKVARSMTVGDFEKLGFELSGHSRDRVALWPYFPDDEREFWLYVALHLEELGIHIPAFLVPISDPEPVRETVENWKRRREIERWQKLLSHLHEDVPVAPPRELDLQLRFGPDHVVIESRRAGEVEFVPMKTPQFRALETITPSECTPEAAQLCQWLSERAEFGHEPVLKYFESDAQSILGEMLRVPWLGSRLVSQNGAPLARPAEPLRWELAAAGDAEDYRLRLVEPDGDPAGPFLAVFQGAPTLYLMRHTVWTGPEVDARAIDPGSEARIPAAALESGHGVRFLRRMGVEIPQRLREKIQTFDVMPLVRCEIQATWPGAKEETCIIEVVGESSDGGMKMVLAPNGWRRVEANDAQRDTNVFYDRTPLAFVPAAMEPLAMKWDEHALHWHLKVTKKFADVFATWLQSLPPDLPLDLRGELASFQKAAVAGTVRLDVEEAGVDWFDLRVVLDVSETELTKEELKLLMDARGGWVRLGTKGWRRLKFNLTDEDDGQLAQLGLSVGDFSSEPQRLHALQLAHKAARRFLPDEQCDRIERRAAELQARVNPEIPKAIKAELRPYQRDGFHFLAYLSANNFGGILADDMGLGKTLQTLTWLVWLREQTVEPLPALVVCPKSVTDNWRAEAERFAPGLRIRVWSGGDLSKLTRETGTADLHVINYAQLRSVGAPLAKAEFLAVILDEGQFIKNPSSSTAQIARSLRVSHRLILSGTPIENRLLDLWSLMAFAMPGALGSRAQFVKLYDGKEDQFARRRLSARVRPFLLRRTKLQVATDLPDRIEEDLYCELEGEQKTLYRAELKRAQQMLLRINSPKQLAQDRFHVLTSLMRLRQICCHPRLIKHESRAESAKLEALIDQLEPLIDEGQKVLVFSQFVQMLDILKAEMEKRKWPHFYLAGQTENRGQLVRDFQSQEGASVFLISLKAGGFGLNLTAASYVVLFDPWWNPAVENQAIDRTHRIGQTNKVIAYRLLIKGSIEEKIRALQTSKRALADDVLGEEKFAQSLTLNDLRHLFED